MRPSVAKFAILLLTAGGFLAACGKDTPSATAGESTAPGVSASAGLDVPVAAGSASAGPSASASPSASKKPATPTGWPNADSTGVQAGVKLTKRSGEILVKKSGTVIQNLDLDGDIRVEANNVTVRNVRIHNNDSDGGPTYWGVVQWMGYSGLVVEHVEMVGASKQELTSGVTNFGGMLTVRYCDIAGISKKAVDSPQGLIEENYLHDPHYFKQADYEIDMIRATGGPAPGTKLVVRHNVILNPQPATSAVGIYTDGKDVAHDILVENNLLGGGGYTLYGGGASDPTYNIVIRGNTFSTRTKGTFGPGVFFNSHGRGNVWSGNKFDNGKTAYAP